MLRNAILILLLAILSGACTPLSGRGGSGGGGDDDDSASDDDDATGDDDDATGDDDDATGDDDDATGDDDDTECESIGGCDCESSVSPMGATPLALLLPLLAVGRRRRR